MDTAYEESTSIATLAVVVRGSNGEVVFCASSRSTHVVSALHGEILTLKFGLEQVLSHGLNNVYFESDSLIAINLLRGGNASLSRFGSLLFDILELSRFFVCSFSHVLRYANGCAHNLIKYAHESI